METERTISGLLRKRDETMAELDNDVAPIDRVLGALGCRCELPRGGRTSRLVIVHRNELRQWLLRELRKVEPLSSRDLAERICAAEGKDIHDKRMICDVTRRVSEGLRLLRDNGAIRGEKDGAARMCGN